MSEKMNILLVEDDKNLGGLLQEYLIAKGHCKNEKKTINWQKEKKPVETLKQSFKKLKNSLGKLFQYNIRKVTKQSSIYFFSFYGLMNSSTFKK